MTVDFTFNRFDLFNPEDVEHSEDSDSEMGKQALPVAPFNIDKVDLKAVPLNAQEYLRQVIAERRQLPSVKTAENPMITPSSKIYCVSLDEITDYPNKPTQEWQNERIARFSELRISIQSEKKSRKVTDKIEFPKTEDEWFQFIFTDNSKPLLSILLQLEDNIVENLIKFIWTWLSNKNLSLHDAGDWLFGLLLVVDMPMTVDFIKVLRRFAKKCRDIREDKAACKNEKDEMAANVFISLVGNYFGQRDLADQY